jgi:Archaeal fructose-1,6-bisphosphatase and related enzymes of inositol monophosphatase family
MHFLKNFIETAAEVKESIFGLERREERIGYTGMGADGTKTSTLDKLAEDSIIERIVELDLPFNIVSEEIGFVDRGYEKNIIMDPLDGTYNAENQIPIYSMSLAIMTEKLSDVEEAIVINLATGNYFWAARGKGAYRNTFPLPQTTRRTRTSVQYVLEDTEVPSFLKEGMTRKRILGCASMEMSLIANGSLDNVAYLGEGKMLRNIDIAAGILLVKETGGYILDGSLHELDMGKDVTQRINMIALSALYKDKVEEFGKK